MTGTPDCVVGCVVSEPVLRNDDRFRRWDRDGLGPSRGRFRALQVDRRTAETQVDEADGQGFDDRDGGALRVRPMADDPIPHDRRQRPAQRDDPLRRMATQPQAARAET